MYDDTQFGIAYNLALEILQYSIIQSTIKTTK